MDVGSGKTEIASINYYQTLLNMVTMTNDLLDQLVAEGRLPAGVTYADGIFKYLPRVLPIDYGKEIETYRNAITVIRSAA